MDVRPDRLQKQLESEALKPIYLVAGSEPLIVMECADAIRRKAKESGYAEREIFDVDNSFDWNELDRELASPSLFSSQRLFDVRMPTGKPGRDGGEALRAFCENPAPDVVLLITGQDWSGKHSGKWSEAISKVGHSIIAWPLKPHEMPEWVQTRCRSVGVVLTPDAVEALINRIEGNLLAAAQEIEKLALLAPKSAIDAQMLEALVADSSRYDVFRLAECALSGEYARVAKILRALRAEGNQVPGLMPWLATEFNRMAYLAQAQAAGQDIRSAMRSERIWDSKQAVYQRALQRHGPGYWQSIPARLGLIDRASKGRGDVDPWLELERMLLSVAQVKLTRPLA